MQTRTPVFRLLSFKNFIVLIGLYSLLVIQLPNFSNDPGVGWHLKTGEFIWQNGSVPRTDPFLYSPTPRAWVADQWLADLWLFLLHRFGGFPLVYAVLTALYLFVFFGILYPQVRRVSGMGIASILAVLAAFKIAQVHFILRPVIFGFLFFALLYNSLYSLQRSHRVKTPSGNLLQKKHRALIILPCIFLLWANVHPSFVIGLICIGIFILGTALDKFFDPSGWHTALRRSFLTFLILLFIAGTFVTVLNPYGIELHRSIFDLTSSEYFMSLHEEWRPANLKNVEGKLLLLMIAMIAASYFWSVRVRESLGSVDLFLFLFFSYAALQSSRMLPFFGIVSVFQLAESSRIFAPLAFDSAFKRLALGFRRLENIELRSDATPLFPLLLGVGVIGFELLSGRVPLYAGYYGPPTQKFPYQAVNQLSSHCQSQLSGEPCIVLASPHWGGFMTWQGQGRILPLLDDRNTLIGERIYRRYYGELRQGGAWRQLATDLRATHLILSAHGALTKDLIASNAVPVVYQDGVAVVFALKHEK